MTALAADSMQDLSHTKSTRSNAFTWCPCFRKSFCLNGVTGLSNGMIWAAATYKKCAEAIKPWRIGRCASHHGSDPG